MVPEPASKRKREALVAVWWPNCGSQFYFRYRHNLVNFGILPLVVDDPECDRIIQGDVLKLTGLHGQVRQGHEIRVENITGKREFTARHNLSDRQIDVLLEGGLINWVTFQGSDLD